MWYGNDGKQRSRRCPNHQAAEVYKLRLEHQLNQEFYQEAVMLPWGELREAFLKEKRTVARLSLGTLRSYGATLNLFEAHAGKPYSTRINHALIGQYVATRTQAGAAPDTINKDLRTLHAFVTWGVENQYMGEAAKQIRWNRLRQKGAGKKKKPLTLDQFARLLATAEKLYGTDWFIRLLLAIGTGLRQGDLERLRIEDIDWSRSAISTLNTKAHKSMPLRPLHTTIIAELRLYLGDRSNGPILRDAYHHSKWERIRTVAGMTTVTYHTLRKSFGAFLADKGFSIAVVQELLEHSTPQLTKNIYMDASREHRRAAQAIPIDEAIKAARDQSGPESDAATRTDRPGDSGRLPSP